MNDRCWRRQDLDLASRNLFYLDGFSDVPANFNPNRLGHWHRWLYLNGGGGLELLSSGTNDKHSHSN